MLNQGLVKCLRFEPSFSVSGTRVMVFNGRILREEDGWSFYRWAATPLLLAKVSHYLRGSLERVSGCVLRWCA